MGVETEKVIIETEVKLGNSGASIKSVKAELRALQNELVNLEPGSKAFQVAATRAGELKDKIGDAKNAVAAFNPEAKFQAFANVLGGVANGFSVAQGAMAVFGSDSKNLQEIMVKTQGAMAIATGLNGLLGMKDAFKLLGSQVVSMIPVLKSFSAAALGAMTGGILIVITLVIGYWKELKELITGTTEAIVLGEDQIAESVKKGHDAFRKASDERYALRRREIELMDEGVEKQKALAKLEHDQKREIAVIGKASAQELLLIENEYQKDLYDIKKEADKKDAERRKTKAEKDLEISKWEDQQIAEGNKQISDDNIAQSEWEDQQILEGNQRIGEEQKAYDTALKASLKQSAQEQYQYESDLAKQLAQDKIDTLRMTANALDGFAQLAGQNTQLGKDLGIATTTIDTYVAAQAAFKSGSAINPALGYIAAAGALAAGFARVRAIIAIKVPMGGGGNSSTPNMSGTSAPPPIVRPSSSVVNIGNQNAIKTSSTNTGGRVYVLESDITSTQKKVDDIRQKTIIK